MEPKINPKLTFFIHYPLGNLSINVYFCDQKDISYIQKPRLKEGHKLYTETLIKGMRQ